MPTVDDETLEAVLGRPVTPAAAPGLDTQGLQARLEASLFDAQRVTRIGGYVIVEVLGEGAMGTVYLAYDPDLDRRVAVKVLRGGGREGVATARMAREARAMARLAHPNVVAVHEVGESEGRTFVAMELVDGGTLAQWCRDDALGSPGRIDRVLDLAMQTAQGLAAAHAAGLVHRDLKPANILVGKDGRARIADFGLARPREETGEPTLPGKGERDSPDSRDSRDSRDSPDLPDSDPRLTASGALVGTPAYMAPEQFRGETDERSDQFGWCVTFFEAVYGIRPFAGSTVVEVLDAIEQERLAKPSPGAHAPGWLRRLLVRGLARDPARRWSSMDAIVAEIGRRRRARWRLAAGGAALLVAGVAMAQGLKADPSPLATSTCPNANGELEAAWGEARRAEIQQAFSRSGAPYADDAWLRLQQGMDDVARDWVGAKSEVCRAGESADPVRVAEAQRRDACLDRSRTIFEFASDQLATADRETVRRSAQTVSALRDLARCDDEALLGLPAERGADLVDQTLADLGRASVLTELHRLSEARDTLRKVITDIPDDGFATLHARAYEELVSVALRADDHATIEDDATRFLDYAERSGDVALRASAWVSMGAAARLSGDLDESAFRLGRAANLATAQPLPARLRANIVEAEARLWSTRQQHAEAIERREAAIAILGENGRDELAAARLMLDLGESRFANGEVGPALDVIEASLETFRDVLGPDHPDTALAHITAANVGVRARDEQTQTHLAEAERVLLANPEFRPSLLGRVHELRGLDMMSDNAADPGPELKQAQEIYARTLGPDHRAVFHVRLFRANAMHTRGRTEEAVDLYRELIEQFAPGDDMPVTFATARMNLADAEAMLGHAAAALAQLALARPVLDAAQQETGLQWRNQSINLARVYRMAGRADVAEEILEEVRVALDADEEPVALHDRLWLDIERAEAALARGRRDEAVALARGARASTAGRDLAKPALLGELGDLERKLGLSPASPETAPP